MGGIAGGVVILLDIPGKRWMVGKYVLMIFSLILVQGVRILGK